MAEYIERQKYMKDKYNCDLIQIDNLELVPLYQIIDKLEQSIERAKIDKAIEESYKKGLTDAWECARKIGNNSQLGLEGMGFNFSELGTYYNPSWWVVLNYDIFKALEILKRNIGE